MEKNSWISNYTYSSIRIIDIFRNETRQTKKKKRTCLGAPETHCDKSISNSRSPEYFKTSFQLKVLRCELPESMLLINEIKLPFGALFYIIPIGNIFVFIVIYLVPFFLLLFICRISLMSFII